jgi:hypothetical protein
VATGPCGLTGSGGRQTVDAALEEDVYPWDMQEDEYGEYIHTKIIALLHI